MPLLRTLKDVARHVMRKVGYDRHFSYLGGSRKQNFTAIYDQKVWTHGDKTAPLSGHGSSLQATAALRQALPAIIRQIEARTLLDLGCGDFTWMQHVDLPCKYVGADIVESVVSKNQRDFGSDQCSFMVMDFVENTPPKADVVLCREVLFHLSFEDVFKGLRNALDSGCSFFLLTSDSSAVFNADIQSGDFRTLNLERRPFKLPAPQTRIEDAEVFSGRYIGLWSADDIRKSIGQHLS